MSLFSKLLKHPAFGVWIGCVFVAAVAAMIGQRWRMHAGQIGGRQEDLGKIKAEIPHLGRSDGYATSNRCSSCHPGEFSSWHQTYHRTMTQLATPDTVIGQFDNSTIKVNGLDYRVYREGDEFWAELPDPDVMMYVVQGVERGTSKQVDDLTYLLSDRRRVVP